MTASLKERIADEVQLGARTFVELERLEGFRGDQVAFGGENLIIWVGLSAL